MEIFEMYCRIGKVEEGNVVLKECIEFCDKNGYTIKKEQLENKLLGKKSMDTRYRLGMKKNEILQITELSKKVGNKIKFDMRQKEITFLSSWQDFLRKDRTTVKLFGKEAVSMLKDTFAFDGILYLTVSNRKPKVLFSELEKKLSKEEIDFIYTFFKSRNNMLAVSRMDKIFNEYDGILEIFDKVVKKANLDQIICKILRIAVKALLLFVALIIVLGSLGISVSSLVFKPPVASGLWSATAATAEANSKIFPSVRP